MVTSTLPFEVLSTLMDQESIDGYLDAVCEEGPSKISQECLWNAVQAQGIVTLAERMGIPAEELLNAVKTSGQDDHEFKVVFEKLKEVFQLDS